MPITKTRFITARGDAVLSQNTVNTGEYEYLRSINILPILLTNETIIIKYSTIPTGGSADVDTEYSTTFPHEFETYASTAYFNAESSDEITEGVLLEYDFTTGRIIFKSVDDSVFEFKLSNQVATRYGYEPGTWYDNNSVAPYKATFHEPHFYQFFINGEKQAEIWPQSTTINEVVYPVYRKAYKDSTIVRLQDDQFREVYIPWSFQLTYSDISPSTNFRQRVFNNKEQIPQYIYSPNYGVRKTIVDDPFIGTGTETAMLAAHKIFPLTGDMYITDEFQIATSAAPPDKLDYVAATHFIVMECDFEADPIKYTALPVNDYKVADFDTPLPPYIVTTPAPIPSGVPFPGVSGYPIEAIHTYLPKGPINDGNYFSQIKLDDTYFVDVEDQTVYFNKDVAAPEYMFAIISSDYKMQMLYCTCLAINPHLDRDQYKKMDAHMSFVTKSRLGLETAVYYRVNYSSYETYVTDSVCSQIEWKTNIDPNLNLSVDGIDYNGRILYELPQSAYSVEFLSRTDYPV